MPIRFMPPNNDDWLDIEVAYTTPDREYILPLRMPLGSSARDAIAHSSLLERVPDIDLSKNKIGVFGKIVALDYRLQQYDRVEIYRPLTIDPKEIRRLRANKTK